MACVRRAGAQDPSTYQLRWPLRVLEIEIGLERLLLWVTQDQVRRWRERGLSDAEADAIAVTLGFMPHNIWSGYMEAGLDYVEVPDAPGD